MICKDIISENGKYFCLGNDNVIYYCKNCNSTSKECEGCVAFPKPTPTNASYGYSNQQEYGFSTNDIMNIIKDKHFLYGVAAGLVLGMLLFNKK